MAFSFLAIRRALKEMLLERSVAVKLNPRQHRAHDFSNMKEKDYHLLVVSINKAPTYSLDLSEPLKEERFTL